MRARRTVMAARDDTERARSDLMVRETGASTDLQKSFSHNRRNGRNSEVNILPKCRKNRGLHMLVDLVLEKPAVTFLFTAQDKERNSAAALKMYLNDKGLLG